MPIVTVDMTGAVAMHAGTKSGSGNVLQDGSDATYFELAGMALGDSDVTSAGWIIADFPDLPDYDHINSMSLTIRADFSALADTPSRASMMIAITGYDGSGTGSGDLFPFEFSQFYAYVLVGTPLTGMSYFASDTPLPVAVQDYTFNITNWLPWRQSDMNAQMAEILSDGGAHFIISPRWYFSDSSTDRVQARIYQASLSINYAVWVPPVFDDPPGLPAEYGAWTELDLSTAIFGEDAGGTPFGKYDSVRDRILTNTGWPDFWFPGFVLDPAKKYYFQFVYDLSDSRHVVSWEDVYMWMLLPDGDTQDHYLNDPYFPVYEDDNFESGEAYHLFHLDVNTENWDQLSNGYILPVFESGELGVLAKIRYAVADGSSVLVPVTPPETVRARFWGQ